MKFTEKQQSLIKIFKDNLLNFNEKYNLIGRSTINDFDNRHLIDSAQIVNFLDKKPMKLIDFGSGSGLPAIILAILRPDCEFHLIEKSFRKGQFLKIMADVIPNIKIFQNKIQDLEVEKYDIITARAFASLVKIFKFSNRFLDKKTILILHKGKKFQEEINEAKNQFKFNIKIKDSISSQEGKILIISNLCQTL
jgi:16S rRNA (guanine527-N7)-methyltransferase